MAVMYKSTRNKKERVSASQAILKGLAEDGGLYVPETIPSFDIEWEKLSSMTYQETAYEVMKLFLGDFTEEELKACIHGAYDDKFDTEEIAPLVKKDNAYYLELFHGRTIAFKDMALSILPYLMTTSAKKNHVNNEIVILTATSGDTGKAALAGFADVAGTSIIVFYPKNGVSPIQEKQMLTQKGENTNVVGIIGNFDDAQAAVKRIFTDPAMNAALEKGGMLFSSANSINWGRLLPQIVYYFYAYFRICKEGTLSLGEPMNVAVPTGNFGNILAAYYAKSMGLPIRKFLCASNANRVLTDFIRTGVYDRRREFFATISPSMDILVSSNLERLLYGLSGQDSGTLAGWMEELAQNGWYDVGEEVRQKVQAQFYGGFCDDAATARTIAETWRTEGYLCDTHTAVALDVYRQYVEETGDGGTPTVIASTASPYKFAADVLGALEPVSCVDEFQNIARLEELTGTQAPAQLTGLKDKPIRFQDMVAKDQAAAYVLAGLNLGGA